MRELPYGLRLPESGSSEMGGMPSEDFPHRDVSSAPGLGEQQAPERLSLTLRSLLLADQVARDVRLFNQG
jgi:hypothetical protein